MMLYLFNNDEQMIKAIPSTAIKSLYQTQVLTDENYINDRLDIELSALDEYTLNEMEYIAISSIEDEQKFHYYFVNTESTEDNLTTITATQSGIEELRKTPVYDMRPNNNELRIILNQLLDGTNWSAGYVPPNLGTLSTNFYYTDVFSSLKKVCLAFGVEMQFFVEVTGNRIGARYIDFYKRTGKSIGKRVVYGHNALKIIKEVEKTNIVTALIGRGKGVQVSESEEGHAGYGRKITFEDVVWSTPEHPVNKPLGQRYVEIPELTAKYGIKNFNGSVRPKFGFIEFPDDEEPEAVLRKTYDALLEQSRPQTLMKTTSLYLPDTGIGDTVRVIRHDRELYYDTRVFEIVWDRLVNKAVDMRLGDRLSESNNRRISNISNQIVSELEPTIVDLIDRLPSADGKNTNWYTSYDPADEPETQGQVRVGDTWFQPDPEFEGETILKVWTGEMWKELIRTADTDRVARQIEAIEQEREDMQADIDQAQRTADDLFLEWENMKDGIEFEMPEMFIDILGDDGKYIYSDNELEVIGEDGSQITSDEVIITLEEGQKRLTSGKGHSIGNRYTLSYVNPRFVERPHTPFTVNLSASPAIPTRIELTSHNEHYPNYDVTVGMQSYNFPKVYHDDYTVKISSSDIGEVVEEITISDETTSVSITIPTWESYSETVDIPFERIVTEDANMHPDDEIIHSAGQVGRKTVSGERELIDGVATGRTRNVSETVISQPVDEVVTIGSGVVTWVGGSRTESVPFATVEYDSDAYYIGQRVTTTAGVDGVRTFTWQEEHLNGVSTGKRRNEASSITTQPVTQRIAVGTKPMDVTEVFDFTSVPIGTSTLTNANSRTINTILKDQAMPGIALSKITRTKFTTSNGYFSIWSGPWVFSSGLYRNEGTLIQTTVPTGGASSHTIVQSEITYLP